MRTFFLRNNSKQKFNLGVFMLNFFLGTLLFVSIQSVLSNKASAQMIVQSFVDNTRSDYTDIFSYNFDDISGRYGVYFANQSAASDNNTTYDVEAKTIYLYVLPAPGLQVSVDSIGGAADVMINPYSSVKYKLSISLEKVADDGSLYYSNIGNLETSSIKAYTGLKSYNKTVLTKESFWSKCSQGTNLDFQVYKVVYTLSSSSSSRKSTRATIATGVLDTNKQLEQFFQFKSRACL
jgi:hypothetical protein